MRSMGTAWVSPLGLELSNNNNKLGRSIGGTNTVEGIIQNEGLEGSEIFLGVRRNSTGREGNEVN